MREVTMKANRTNTAIYERNICKRNRGEKRMGRRKTKNLLLVAAAAILALVISVMIGAGLVMAQDENGGKDTTYTYYKSIEIQDGDTLWALAEEYADGETSVQDYVKELKEINDLSIDGDIHSGQYLTVMCYDNEYR